VVVSRSGRLAFAAEQAANRFADFVDDLADRRFGAGNAGDDFFGDFGDARVTKRPTKRLIGAGNRVVDGAGDSA
jgi:hypothetical protein